MTKKNLGQIVLGVYVVGSMVYIGSSLWTNFKVKYTEEVFQNGQTDVIERLITQAEDPGCQPISVYTADQEVQLISVTCVQASTDTETTNQE